MFEILVHHLAQVQIVIQQMSTLVYFHPFQQQVQVQLQLYQDLLRQQSLLLIKNNFDIIIIIIIIIIMYFDLDLVQLFNQLQVVVVVEGLQ